MTVKELRLQMFINMNKTAQLHDIKNQGSVFGTQKCVITIQIGRGSPDEGPHLIN